MRERKKDNTLSDSTILCTVCISRSHATKGSVVEGKEGHAATLAEVTELTSVVCSRY